MAVLRNSPKCAAARDILRLNLRLGEREISNLKKSMRQWVFSAWGVQTGPFAALCTFQILKIFQLFHFHTGRPILITPEGQYWEKGNLTPQEKNETVCFQCPGHSNWTSVMNPICSDIFVTFHFHTLGSPFSFYTPGQDR